MTFLRWIDRFWLLRVACPRLYLVLVRTLVELAKSDCELLLSWPFSKRLGWSLSVPVVQWPRCEFAGDRLVTLTLAGLDLPTLPKSIGRLTALQSLQCFNNQLTALPESIGRLVALRKLGCGNNRLTSLPRSIGQLATLQVLWCGCNRLTSLPESIGRLTALEDLWCGNNQLASIPTWATHLVN